MIKLVLANIDYSPGPDRGHMTDEGHQLQAGLEAAGWVLAGFGYGDGSTDVPTLLARHRPSIVFVQDKRDWSPDCSGCFNPAVAFQNLSALKEWPCAVVAPVKDAGSLVDYQRAFLEEITRAPAKRPGPLFAVLPSALPRSTTAVIYYHPESVLKVSPWLAEYGLVRTYHSIDGEFCAEMERGGKLGASRRRGIVSGAASAVYPLRQRAIAAAGTLGLTVMRHPGYGNRGACTQDYLQTLANYRVHVATASKYGFALRKIIESVAVGCVPVTDLPAFDVLPEIDAALVRVGPAATVEQLREAIDRAERGWNLDRAMHFARACWAFYDWRAIGRRLSGLLCKDSLPQMQTDGH